MKKPKSRPYLTMNVLERAKWKTKHRKSLLDWKRRPEHYTVQDLCAITGLSVVHINRLIREGKIKATRVGKQNVISKKEALRIHNLSKRLVPVGEVRKILVESGFEHVPRDVTKYLRAKGLKIEKTVGNESAVDRKALTVFLKEEQLNKKALSGKSTLDDIMRSKRAYFSVNFVAGIFRVNSRTVRRWIREGKIAAEKVKGSVVIPKEELVAFWRTKPRSKAKDSEVFERKIKLLKSLGITKENFPAIHKFRQISMKSLLDRIEQVQQLLSLYDLEPRNLAPFASLLCEPWNVETRKRIGEKIRKGRTTTNWFYGKLINEQLYLMASFGDNAARNKLIENLKEMPAKVASIFKTRERELNADILAEGYRVLTQKVDQFLRKGEPYIGGRLYLSVKNAMVDELKKIFSTRGRQWKYEQLLKRDIKQRPRVEETLSDLIRREGTRKAIQRFEKDLGQLPTEFASVAYLYYFEGLKSKDIADILKINPATARTRLLRAQQMLRKMGYAALPLYNRRNKNKK